MQVAQYIAIRHDITERKPGDERCETGVACALASWRRWWPTRSRTRRHQPGMGDHAAPAAGAELPVMHDITSADALNELIPTVVFAAAAPKPYAVQRCGRCSPSR